MIKGAVLGSPISHSLSPTLHQAAFKSLGISGSYEAREVKSGELKNFLDLHGENFDYFSLTMPLKEEVLNLDFFQSPEVAKAQSANTLIKRDNKWLILSTDGSGFLAALSEISFSKFGNVLILGAGGTARAICAALDGLAQSITVLGRTSTRKDVLAQIVVQSTFTYQSWSDSIDISQYSLVINTTPSGAADLIGENLFRTDGSLLFDVIYKPWPTRLAARWMDLGGQVISGLELLLYQGIHQLEIVTERNIENSAVIAQLRRELSVASQ